MKRYVTTVSAMPLATPGSPKPPIKENRSDPDWELAFPPVIKILPAEDGPALVQVFTWVCDLSRESMQ